MTHMPGAGDPFEVSREDLQEELQSVKRELNTVGHERDVVQARLRKAEEDIGQKDKQIEELLASGAISVSAACMCGSVSAVCICGSAMCMYGSVRAVCMCGSVSAVCMCVHYYDVHSNTTHTLTHMHAHIQSGDALRIAGGKAEAFVSSLRLKIHTLQTALREKEKEMAVLHQDMRYRGHTHTCIRTPNVYAHKHYTACTQIVTSPIEN